MVGYITIHTIPYHTGGKMFGGNRMMKGMVFHTYRICDRNTPLLYLCVWVLISIHIHYVSRYHTTYMYVWEVLSMCTVWYNTNITQVSRFYHTYIHREYPQDRRLNWTATTYLSYLLLNFLYWLLLAPHTMIPIVSMYVVPYRTIPISNTSTYIPYLQHRTIV